jgi:hypothetical protein
VNSNSHVFSWLALFCISSVLFIVRSSGLVYAAGFLFFYEMLTGSLDFTFCESVPTHDVAAVLLRLLPASDTEEGLLMSVLRLLEANPDVAKEAPKFHDQVSIAQRRRP